MKNTKRFDLLKHHPDKQENWRLLNKLIVLAYLPSNMISATYLPIKSESKLLDRVNGFQCTGFRIGRKMFGKPIMLDLSRNIGIRPDAWNFTSK